MKDQNKTEESINNLFIKGINFNAIEDMKINDLLKIEECLKK